MTTVDFALPGYQIEREVGRGGMASVFLARQESLNRSVALKIMSSTLSNDEDFRTRFLNEGRIIAQLNHSHIVTIYDIGCHRDLYYLAMEYLPGGTLREKLRAGLAPQEALRIAEALAKALSCAHQRGFIHRDFKPLNVLFREDGSPVLTDFGIAKTLGVDNQLTRTGFALGSAGYMSPEQALGRPIDQRTDVYSFGVVLWEMLTGKPPYSAPDVFALALKHATEPIPRLPAPLTRFQPLLDRLLAKQPEERHAGLDDVIKALAMLDKTASGPAVVQTPTPEYAPTVVRPVAPGPAGTAPASAPPQNDESETIPGLDLVEREQQGLLIRLPDYIEAVRIGDPVAAGNHLATCHELVQTISRISSNYLQSLGNQSLSVADFDRLHGAMDRHARLDTLTGLLLEFARLVLTPVQGDSLRYLKDNMVEGLDAILLILRDAVREQDGDALMMAKMITGDRSDLMQKLRQSYLTDATRALGNDDKMVLLKLTGQFERLVWALGAVVQRLSPNSDRVSG